MSSIQASLVHSSVSSTLNGMICPNCFSPMVIEEIQHTKFCHHCSWQYQEIEGIPILLSSTDQNDSFFQDYLQNYKQISLDDLAQSIQPPKYLSIMSNRFVRDVLKFIGKDVSGLNICELGVGQGHFFNKIANLNPRLLVGIDISIPYLKQFRTSSNVKTVVANAENVPFKNKFDLLVASDILEHVINVGDFLYSTNRSLKDNGAFVVKVPLNENLNQYSRLTGCPYRFVHLRNFTEQSLKTVLESAGFEVERILYDGFLDYRVRKFISQSKLLKSIFNLFLKVYCKGSNVDIANINRHLGRLMMEPVEIIACCRKVRNVL